MKILMPLAAKDFDPSESAIPWKLLTEARHEVLFATPAGRPGHADERMLTGEGLGPWRPLLRAREDARKLYAEMERSASFRAPCSYRDVASLDLDGAVFPGGHAPGMKPYLEAEELQRCAAHLLGAGKPVGAICHGVVAVARAQDPATGRSVLHGRKTTALLRSMELMAWGLTRFWLGSYYRTYPETVEAEVRRHLAAPEDFQCGPFAVLRDTPTKLARGFTVRDSNFLSARWPGDSYRFATEYLAMLR